MDQMEPMRVRHEAAVAESNADAEALEAALAEYVKPVMTMRLPSQSSESEPESLYSGDCADVSLVAVDVSSTHDHENFIYCKCGMVRGPCDLEWCDAHGLQIYLEWYPRRRLYLRCTNQCKPLPEHVPSEAGLSAQTGIPEESGVAASTQQALPQVIGAARGTQAPADVETQPREAHSNGYVSVPAALISAGAAPDDDDDVDDDRGFSYKYDDDRVFHAEMHELMEGRNYQSYREELDETGYMALPFFPSNRHRQHFMMRIAGSYPSSTSSSSSSSSSVCRP